MNLRRLSLAVLLLLFVSSCKDDYTFCNVPTSVYFTVGFYHHGSSGDTPVTPTALTLYQLNAATPVYDSAHNLQTFTLPLNPLVDSAMYTINVGHGVSDTLTVLYSSRSVNLSAECGNVFENTIFSLRLTDHTLTGIVAEKPDVTTAGGENARIYF